MKKVPGTSGRSLRDARPGDVSQALMFEATSVCRALRRSVSRSLPGGSNLLCLHVFDAIRQTLGQRCVVFDALSLHEAVLHITLRFFPI